MSDDNILPFKKPEPQPEADCRLVDESGVEWFKFGVEFGFDGGTWNFYIWARDLADAESRLEAIKQNASVFGQIYAQVPA